MPATEQIHLRVTSAQLAQLRAQAAKADKTLTSYVLSRCLPAAGENAPVPVKPELVGTSAEELLTWVEPAKPKARGWWEQRKLDLAAERAAQEKAQR